jgi:cell fate (sporulation/competence/biofilm development) regulator YlbF (YheA/YmcA/DUF963 family)
MNVRVKAQELANALANSGEFTNYKNAKAKVDESTAASKMLDDFNKQQSELRMAQMKGETVTDDQIAQLKKSYEIISFNPYIREYFGAEFALMQLMTEIQQTLAKAIELDMPAVDEEDIAAEDEKQETTPEE